MNLKSALKEKLTKKEQSKLITSFDVVGGIAILEIPLELEKKEKIIAKTLLGLHKNIKTVVKKISKHRGFFRLQKFKIITGRRKKETIHKENNVKLKLHIEKVYFSPRLSTERKRIAQLIKPEENVLVMFSGCSPYPCVIARNSEAREIVGIELNPEAHRYALENIKLNKLRNIKLFLGDVRNIIPKLKKKFNRILMPLPKGGEGYLGVALKAAKKGTIIHFYDFQHKDEFNKAVGKVKKACIKEKRKCRILRTLKCGQFSPRVYRICVDFIIKS